MTLNGIVFILSFSDISCQCKEMQQILQTNHHPAFLIYLLVLIAFAWRLQDVFYTQKIMSAANSDGTSLPFQVSYFPLSDCSSQIFQYCVEQKLLSGHACFYSYIQLKDFQLFTVEYCVGCELRHKWFQYVDIRSFYT